MSTVPTKPGWMHVTSQANKRFLPCCKLCFRAVSVLGPGVVDFGPKEHMDVRMRSATEWSGTRGCLRPLFSAISSNAIKRMASCRLLPHTIGSGLNWAQTCGRRTSPHNSHRASTIKCRHATPAGLPLGIFGNGVDIDGAMQHAPQPGRQSINRASGECVR